MKQALTSAREAVGYAASAQTSASTARAAALQAGEDAEAAATAASEARQISINLARQEEIARLRALATRRRQHQEAGTNPADDDPDVSGDDRWIGPCMAPAPNDAVTDAERAQGWGTASTWIGVAALAAAIVTAPLTGGASIVLLLGAASVVAGGVSTYYNAQAYGTESEQFRYSLGTTAVGALFVGQGSAVMGAARSIPKSGTVWGNVAEGSHDVVTGGLSTYLGFNSP
jgi:hypothetical protein